MNDVMNQAMGYSPNNVTNGNSPSEAPNYSRSYLDYVECSVPALIANMAGTKKLSLAVLPVIHMGTKYASWTSRGWAGLVVFGSAGLKAATDAQKMCTDAVYGPGGAHL